MTDTLARKGGAPERRGASLQPPSTDVESDDTTCPQCGESSDLAKVKGCVKCLKCGFKFDCNGW